MCFARVDKIVNKMRLVGVDKAQDQIVEIIIDRLPPQFCVEKVIFRCDPDTAKQLVEETIVNAYAHHCREVILKAPAVPITPKCIVL